MIAVFCPYHRDFADLRLTPKRLFVRVLTINGLRGRKFTGVIRIGDWHKDPDQREAHAYLEATQPELFK